MFQASINLSYPLIAAVLATIAIWVYLHVKIKKILGGYGYKRIDPSDGVIYIFFGGSGIILTLGVWLLYFISRVVFGY